jgi:glutamate--cysteine ligase
MSKRKKPLPRWIRVVHSAFPRTLPPCRIGTEHEKLAFNVSDGTRAGYTDIEHVLDRLVSRFKWEPMMENGKIIGCKRDGQSVTLEPGGQFELSGAPLANLHQTCDEVNSHLYQAKAISGEVGVGFLGVGFDPKWTIDEIPMMPKDRYKIMRNYMPKVGTLGLDMMFRSCTIQVRLSK